MGIPESALPCIVVTTDLKSKDLVWFGTSAVSVEEQLRSLGYLAWQHNRDQVKDALLAEHMNFDATRPSGLVSLNTSMAQAIADVLSFPVYRTGESDVRNATERARKTLGVIFSSLKEQKNKSTDPEDEPESSWLEEFESTALKGLSFLSLLAARPDLTLIPGATEFPIAIRASRGPMPGEAKGRYRERYVGFPEDVTSAKLSSAPEDAQRWPNLRRLGKALEAESVYMLKTALLVQDLFESRPELVNGLLEDQLDYTPTVICLAKVFEREANLSVVHWIREHLHISLPTYFNKYQPEIRALFTPDRPNPQAIDFNKEKYGIWIPPGLGQSEIACRAFGRTSPPEGWSKNKWSRLMDGWCVIRVGRNNSAHTELVDKGSAMRIGEAIDRLAEDRIFESMRALKAKYRGF